MEDDEFSYPIRDVEEDRIERDQIRKETADQAAALDNRLPPGWDLPKLLEEREMAEYTRPNPRHLGEYYTRHVAAMTEEGLHDKAEIAAELAIRDKHIDRLRNLHLEAQNRVEDLEDEVMRLKRLVGYA